MFDFLSLQSVNTDSAFTVLFFPCTFYLSISAYINLFQPFISKSYAHSRNEAFFSQKRPLFPTQPQFFFFFFYSNTFSVFILSCSYLYSRPAVVVFLDKKSLPCKSRTARAIRWITARVCVSVWQRGGELRPGLHGDL